MAYVGGPITARRVLIAMAQRRQRRGTGSGAAFVRERTAWQQWPNLDAVLAPLAWAVVGAVATRQYMPERATGDLDVVVAKADAAAARAKLQTAGYAFRGELRIGGSTWHSPDGQDVDVIEGADAWWPTALGAAQANRDGQGLPVLPLPYLVLIKLQAGGRRISPTFRGCSGWQTQTRGRRCVGLLPARPRRTATTWKALSGLASWSLAKGLPSAASSSWTTPLAPSLAGKGRFEAP